MSPKFARSSAFESRRSRAACVLVLVGHGFAACAPMDAEVAAVPPLDGSAGRVDGPLGDGPSIAPEGSIDASEAGVVRCDSAAPLRLYYWNLRTAALASDVNYIVKVENATGVAIALRALEMRYYFTNELSPPTEMDVFYADTCCSNKRTDFNDAVVMSLSSIAEKPSANAYLSIAFASAAGTLAAGDAVQVEIAFHDVAYARMLTQSNDYSFLASAGGTQAQWDRCPGPQCEIKFTSCAVTVHRDGALVWGTPP